MRLSGGDEVILPDSHQTRQSGATINRSLTSSDARLMDTDHRYQSTWDSYDSGTKARKHSAVHHAQTGMVEGVKYARRLTLGHEGNDECSAPLTLSIKAAAPEGAPLFTSILKLQQRCMD